MESVYRVGMSLAQSTLGQFYCALKGGHSVSEKAEDNLYEGKAKSVLTECTKCGMSIRIEIDKNHPELYIITEV
jgi:hypothetical protein